MSVRDLNKVIILSSALTGEVIFQIDFDDYFNCNGGYDLFNYKVSELIDNEEGASIKIGFKS